MRPEKGNFIYSEHYYKQALSKIEVLKKQLSEEKEVNKKSLKIDPVTGAIENLNFINKRIKPITADFFEQRRPTRKLMFTPVFTLDFSKLFYNPELQRLQIHIPKIGEDLDNDLSEDSIKKLWERDARSRHSIKLLANLSKEKIVQKFENYILSNK